MSVQSGTESVDSERVLVDTDVDEPVGTNERRFIGWQSTAIAIACAVYTAWHLVVLNYWPVETWTYRIMHIAGGLILGFFLVSAASFENETPLTKAGRPARQAVLAIASLLVGFAGICVLAAYVYRDLLAVAPTPPWVFSYFGPTLALGTGIAIVAGCFMKGRSDRIQWVDTILAMAAVTARSPAATSAAIMATMSGSMSSFSFTRASGPRSRPAAHGRGRARPE